VALEQATGTHAVEHGSVPLSEEYALEFAERWQDAWNSRDPRQVAAYCTDDIVWADALTDGPERGKAAVIAYLESLWRTFPDLEFDWPEKPYCSYDKTKLACHWHVTGTMLGAVEPEGFAPTGRRIDAEGTDLLELRDGLVCNYVGFFDARGMAQQAGVLPARGSRAERIAVTLQRLASRAGRRKR
jgi:steroid delta-isomerase-like uncharacterized protein